MDEEKIVGFTGRYDDMKGRPLDPGSLVGSFFLKDHGEGIQTGRVLAEPQAGVYLVEVFIQPYDEAARSHQELATLPDMIQDRWKFYDTIEKLQGAYHMAMTEDRV